MVISEGRVIRQGDRVAWDSLLSGGERRGTVEGMYREDDGQITLIVGVDGVVQCMCLPVERVRLVEGN